MSFYNIGMGEVKLPGPEVSTKEAIGITVAIVGNILISFSLNLQKLAHHRLEIGREGQPAENDVRGVPRSPEATETAPLLPFRESNHSPGKGAKKPKRKFLPFKLLFRGKSRTADMPVGAGAAEPPTELSPTASSPTLDEQDSQGGLPSSGSERQGLRGQGSGSPENGQEVSYLRSKLWWLGFLLMNLGETGNFISYGFAPASVVAPLGTFALIANCLFAPLMLKEQFRKLDLLGITVAIIGAVTVVLSSNPSDKRLGPAELLQAISHPAFIVYAALYAAAAVILGGLSERSPGDVGGTGTLSWLAVDVGMCALFGGFTVLSTKAISTLLTTEGYKMFGERITYPLLLILAATGVGQIRYLNRALMRFDSKIVIPSQFVLFNLSAIVGSAILYGDFRKAAFHQMVTFLYGCAATFAGVFIIAWTPGQVDRDRDETAEDDGGDVASELQAPQRRVGAAEVGSFSRRNRAALVMPNAVPMLRHRSSVVSLVGLAPAQRLLLVHSPPRRGGPLHDTELGQRPRATSWYGERPGGWEVVTAESA